MTIVPHITMSIDLTPEDRNTLLGGPVSAAMAVMAVDMGIVSCAMEAMAMGKELAAAASRHSDDPLIASLFDREALKQGIRPDRLEVTPEDVRNGRVLDKALVEVDEAMALVRSKTDEAGARTFAQLIVDCCDAVAQAAGRGLFGSGEKVSDAEKAALARIRTHLGLQA